MRALRDWSARRLALTALLWTFGLPVAAALVASARAWWALRTYAAHARAVLPPQGTDLIIDVSQRELTTLAVLMLAPPVVLVLAWWRARGRGDRDAHT